MNLDDLVNLMAKVILVALAVGFYATKFMGLW